MNLKLDFSEYSSAYPCKTHMGEETTQIVRGGWDLARYRTSRFSADSASSDSRPDRSALAGKTKEFNAKFIQRL
ncbi:MAG: hypothetical protein H7252_00290 [Cytophaga sp.]|nr:hypothetical protein [Undibacterium sp.]